MNSDTLSTRPLLPNSLVASFPAFLLSGFPPSLLCCFPVFRPCPLPSHIPPVPLCCARVPPRRSSRRTRNQRKPPVQGTTPVRLPVGLRVFSLYSLLTFISGQSTPVPDDAPPSAHVLSQARKQARARRIFYSIDYTPRVSYLDPRSDYHKFGGFFNLFWIGLPIMFFTKVARNYKETGNMLLTGPWSLLVANIWSLAVSDLAMVSTTALSLPLHRLYRNSNGWLRWSRGGIVVQSLYELGWFILWVK